MKLLPILCKTNLLNPINNSTSLPEALTPCFVFTFCPMLSSIFALICFIFLWFYTTISNIKPKLLFNKLLIFKLLIHLIIFGLSLIRTSFIAELVDTDGRILPEFTANTVFTNLFTVMNLLSYYYCWQYGIPSSMFLHLSWFIGSFSYIPMNIFLIYYHYDLIQLIFTSMHIFLSFLLTILLIWPDKYPSTYFNYENDENGLKIFPDVISSGLSRAFFSYTTHMIQHGYSNLLDDSCFWSLDPGHNPDEVILKFKKHFYEYQKMFSNWKNHSWLFFVLIRSTLFSMSAAVILATFLSFSSLTEPLFLNLIVTSVQKNYPLWVGLILAFLSSFISICWFGLTTRGDFYGQRGYIDLKSILLNVIYEKTLKLTPEARSKYSTGEIINLWATDTERVRAFWFMLLDYFYAFSLFVCSFIGLFYFLGKNTLYGFSIIVLFIPINSLCVKFMSKFERIQMKYKDERLKLMTDILSGIKILKLYGWEESMRKRVDEIRVKEVKQLKYLYIVNALFSGALAICPLLAIVTSFVGYLLIDKKQLTPQVAFISLMLFSQLKYAIYSVPTLFHQAIKVTVSLKRISKFLLEPEMTEQKSTFIHDNVDVMFSLKNADYSWSQNELPFLKNLTVDVRSNELIGIIGKVGSGKSSLLSAICGQMHLINGNFYKKDNLTLAYVPQEAWIQNLTLKDNILFDKGFDDLFYNKIVESCALIQDLKILPAGDMTEIGEKGLNLSGGQKARVSLARAVYQQADVYILDDTLSAVDSHVGSHIFEQVISNSGLLKDKTRIFALNSINYLSHCSRIIIMDNGNIIDVGTFDELSTKNNKIFNDLVLELKQKEKICEDTVRTRISRSVDDEEIELTEDHHPKLIETSRLIEDEKLIQEKVSLKMYTDYSKSFGLIFVAIYFILMFFARTGLESSAQVFMSKWSNEAINRNHTVPVEENFKNLIIYSTLGVASCIILAISNSVVAFGAYQASRRLHDQLLISLLQSPMEFFDKTPSGRILNRLSKDIDVIDGNIPGTLKSVLTSCSNVTFYLLSSIFVIPYIAILTLPFIFGVSYLVQCFTRTTVQLRRLTTNSWSIVTSHLQDSCIGHDVIKIMKQDERFKQKMLQNGNKNAIYHLGQIVANKWVNQKMDMLAQFITDAFTVVGLILASFGMIHSGVLALVISTSSMLKRILGSIARQFKNAEIEIVSVERVQEYIDNDKEFTWINKDISLPHQWPSTGEIIFANLSFKYRNSTPLILDNFSIKFESGKKIGIVGRTGSGKSTLIMSLFRIVEPVSGTIYIDNFDYRKLGLHQLRQILTIIPQDPVIFCGTLRSNLDPFDTFTDDELYETLEKSHLNTFFEKNLNFEIQENGANLSIGQKQLICLARAILRKNTKILILDEATSSVDYDTDKLIQQSIRNEFSQCTILTIAHRLNTILDYDQIVVMDSGEAIEFDTPKNLLKNDKSLFYSLAKQSGII